MPGDRPSRSRPAVVSVALVVAVVLGVGGLLLSRHLDTSARAQPPAARARVSAPAPSAPATSAPATSAPATSAPATSAPATSAPATALRGWPARLAALDALRGRAFAERRPDLLRGVYASAALLQADTASLVRIVPGGCGLRGVRTTYRDVRVIESADRAVLIAQATLAPSTLTCSGTARGRAAGVGPTRMRVTLIGPLSSARIAEQQRV